MSNATFSKKIAIRYLWTKRSEAFITLISVISVLGVAVGVLVLNTTMSIMTGFQHELKAKLLGTNSHILVGRSSGLVADWERVQKSISALPGIQSVSAYTRSQALVRTDAASSGVLIKGLAQGSASANELGRFVTTAGGLQRLFDPGEIEITRPDGTTDQARLPGIIVGRELARSLGLHIGSPLALLSSQVRSSPLGLTPRFKRFVIVGFYSSGLVEYESSLAYVALPAAQKFFRLGERISGFEVRVDNVDHAPRIALDVVNALGGFATGFYATDWTQTHRALWEALRLEKTVYFIVLLLIIVMASFSIVSTLIMIVLEKRKDIGILKTIGASSRSVARIFVFQGCVIGVCGTLLGTLGGVLTCLGLQWYEFPLNEKIFPFSTLPIRMEPLNFVLVAVSAFVICALATIYPAIRASKVDPVAMLRYE